MAIAPEALECPNHTGDGYMRKKPKVQGLKHAVFLKL
jgi:hypothetical protein